MTQSTEISACTSRNTYSVDNHSHLSGFSLPFLSLLLYFSGSFGSYCAQILVINHYPCVQSLLYSCIPYYIFCSDFCHHALWDQSPRTYEDRQADTRGWTHRQSSRVREAPWRKKMNTNNVRNIYHYNRIDSDIFLCHRKRAIAMDGGKLRMEY